jgi:hypothetical protein
MKSTQLTPVQRYGPYLGIVVALVLILAIVPSTTPDRTNSFAASSDDGSSLSAGSSRVAGRTVTTGADGSTVDTLGEFADEASVPTNLQENPEAVVSEEAKGGITGEDCSRRKELGPTYPCKPLWSGDNGGATYKGVTKDKIRVVWYRAKANPAVNAVLAGGGIASSDEEQDREIRIYTQYFQKMSQTWGRTVESIVFHGNADANDAAAFRADAVKIDQEIKAAVVIGAGSADMIDELARRGISCLCGNQMPGGFMRAHKPFVFGILPDGDTTNEHNAEYICRRLGPNSKADFSGDMIHPTIGAKGKVERRYGLLFPNTDFGVPNAKDFAARVKSMCGISMAVQIGYASDINTATQQAVAATQQLIQNKVTTAICVCDPIAPVFATTAAQQQNYQPEWLMTGYLLIDAEALARLYNQNQWSHAFGVSSLPAPVKREESGYYKAYKTMDKNTEPNKSSAPLIFPAAQIVFAGLEGAGPKLNPQTFAEGMYKINTASTGPSVVAFGYSPTDFGGIDDFREVWWDPNATDANGDTGVYQGVGGHWRWYTGKWPTSKTLVFRRDCLALGSCGTPKW